MRYTRIVIFEFIYYFLKLYFQSLKAKIEQYMQDKDNLSVQLNDINLQKEQLEKQLEELNVLFNNSKEYIEKCKYFD